jgi:hypothetical protein
MEAAIKIVLLAILLFPQFAVKATVHTPQLGMQMAVFTWQSEEETTIYQKNKIYYFEDPSNTNMSCYIKKEKPEFGNYPGAREIDIYLSVESEIVEDFTRSPRVVVDLLKLQKIVNSETEVLVPIGTSALDHPDYSSVPVHKTNGRVEDGSFCVKFRGYNHLLDSNGSDNGKKATPITIVIISPDARKFVDIDLLATWHKTPCKVGVINESDWKKGEEKKCYIHLYIKPRGEDGLDTYDRIVKHLRDVT